MTTDLLSDDVKKSVVAGLVQALLAELKEDLQLLTIPQVCGLLNVDPRTLQSMKINRITLKAGQFRYRACDVAKFINERREK